MELLTERKYPYDDDDLSLNVYWGDDDIGDFKHLDSVGKYIFEPNPLYKQGWSEEVLTAILEKMNGINKKN